MKILVSWVETWNYKYLGKNFSFETKQILNKVDFVQKILVIDFIWEMINESRSQVKVEARERERFLRQ